mmetsp:Transcript_43328/g.120491  ORF Transcript_43328/g.120491 Transcript_43328/m.120491 type:complete len:256 (-) Transcript_43328:88-855(-)
MPMCAPVRSRSPCREPVCRLPRQLRKGPSCTGGFWPTPKPVPGQFEVGGTFRVGELDCYISGGVRPGGPGVVVLAHDVWGPNGGLMRSACDDLASIGYLVVMPDFCGTVEPEKGSEWLQRFQRAHARKQLDSVHRFLRRVGVARVGSVGFSWGAWAAARISREGTRVRASVWCHPSSLSGWEHVEGESQAELAAAVRVPTLILPSRNSPELRAGGALASAMHANGVEHDVVYFKGASAEWIAQQVDAWFSKHMAA